MPAFQKGAEPARALVQHPLAPIYDPQSRVLLLGTMPSPVSRQQRFYYAHPQNRFWKTLCAVLGEPFCQTAEARRALCLRRGVALWDVLQSCAIRGAADSSIQDPVANDFAPLLQEAKIQAVFATGQTAARLYRKLCQSQTGLPIAVLPSPSAANCAVSQDILIEKYRAILPFLDV